MFRDGVLGTVARKGICKEVVADESDDSGHRRKMSSFNLKGHLLMKSSIGKVIFSKGLDRMAV